MPINLSEDNLISLLEALIRDIKNEKLSIEDQQHLWIFLNSKNQEERELIKYMFIGWYLCSQMPAKISP